MGNGHKALDMARSLLPSKSRKTARIDKAHVKRASRHNIRMELHNTTLDPEYYDESSVNFYEYPDHEIRNVVMERRGSDKTKPFERWAKAITKSVDQDSRLTYVKSLVPDGVIGDHAISHIKWRDHFSTRAEIELEKNKELNAQDRRKKNLNKKISEKEQQQLLYKIVEDGRLHRDLNKFVADNAGYIRPTITKTIRIFNEETNEWESKYKAIYLDYPPGTDKRMGVRKLLGIHDIAAYLVDIRKSQFEQRAIIFIDKIPYANPYHYGNAYRALYSFLKAVYFGQKVPRRLEPNDYSWY